jgi:two-component system OmpR family response regulator
VEDDRETAGALGRGLRREGHRVSVAGDAPAALGFLDAEAFDVAVLDLTLPRGSGYEVLERVRAERRSMRVLILTARGSVGDRVEGLDKGADDYLVKPFSFAELAARLRALERRGESEPTELRMGALRLDLIRGVATAGERRIDLTPVELRLLACLLRAGGEAVGRRELLREVWGYDFDPGTNVVDVHVGRLRRKLEDADLPGLVRTLRGRGYAAG